MAILTRRTDRLKVMMMARAAPIRIGGLLVELGFFKDLAEADGIDQEGEENEDEGHGKEGLLQMEVGGEKKNEGDGDGATGTGEVEKK